MSEIWRPTPARVAEANLTRFIASVSARRGLQLHGYDDLYSWSISEPSDFWRELAHVADGLEAAGVIAGDRVTGLLPNIPEAAIAMLAATSLGAVWSSCSPDFGVHGVLDRFGQITPKVLFTADGYFYAGKSIDSLSPVAEVLAKIPSIQRVVVIPYVNAEPDLRRLGGASSKATRFDEFGTSGSGGGANGPV